MNLFLTAEEVYRITRKRQRAAQRRVLLAKGYAFDEDAAGWPLVLRTTVEQRHAAQPRQEGPSSPDSAALALLMVGR